MTLIEFWPSVVELSRIEKLRLLQLLADNLAQEELPSPIPLNSPLPIWSPFDSYDAAAKLLQALADEPQPRS